MLVVSLFSETMGGFGYLLIPLYGDRLFLPILLCLRFFAFCFPSRKRRRVHACVPGGYAGTFGESKTGGTLGVFALRTQNSVRCYGPRNGKIVVSLFFPFRKSSITFCKKSTPALREIFSPDMIPPIHAPHRFPQTLPQ